MRLKRLHILTGAVVIAALILVIFIGLRFAEMSYADRSAVDAITPGLSHSNVVELLGVMYDSAKPGEYADMDSVLTGMQSKESIARLCVWRVRNTRDLFWVGLDDSDTVISAWLQKR